MNLFRWPKESHQFVMIEEDDEEKVFNIRK